MRFPLLILVFLALAGCAPNLFEAETYPPPQENRATLIPAEKPGTPSPRGTWRGPRYDALSYVNPVQHGCPIIKIGSFDNEWHPELKEILDAMNWRFADAWNSDDEGVQHLVRILKKEKDALTESAKKLGLPTMLFAFPICTPESGMIRVRMLTELHFFTRERKAIILGIIWRDLDDKGVPPNWDSYLKEGHRF